MQCPFVRSLIVRDVAISTNDLARELVLGGKIALPLVVWARWQTAGRGRSGRTWWSDEGSLTFTLALDPDAHQLRAEHEPRIALAVAVAIVDVLEPLLAGERLGIRWPNDLEASGRKLGGILVERVETATGPRLLIGIGLNVWTQLANAPVEIQRMATSIEQLSPRHAQRAGLADLLRSILASFEAVLMSLVADDPMLVERWNALDTLAGKWVRIDLGPRVLVGLGRGIDRTGGLRLATEFETITCHGGQVLREE